MLGPTLRVADSAGFRWSLRVCVPNKFPSDTDAANPGPHSEPLVLSTIFSTVAVHWNLQKHLALLLTQAQDLV